MKLSEKRSRADISAAPKPPSIKERRMATPAPNLVLFREAARITFST